MNMIKVFKVPLNIYETEKESKLKEKKRNLQ